MTLPLTPDTLRAAYEYLATTPPFNRWNMPDSEDVEFRVASSRRICGWYRRVGGKHRITISSGTIGRTASLIETVAHEMIHLHQGDTCMENQAQHNAAFMKLAAKVCGVHGFDERLF